MMNRSGITRLETRSTRANKDDTVKRVMLTVERVRKWEKKWVNADTDGCTLKIYKWVPVASDNLKQVKPMKKDNMSGISDMSTNTNSPLVLQENNLNSISCPGKQNEEISVQQQTIVTNNSNKEPNRHSNIHQRSNKSDLKLDSNGIPSNEPKDTLNANNSGDAEVAMATSSSDVGKVIQDGDDGEDSSLAPSIASEDSTSLMYHLGINIGGENEDSRQSFQSATDSENSPDNNTKSPNSSSAPQLNISQATTQSFDITASTFESNVSSSKVESENNEGEEPPLKRAREQP